MPEVPRRAKNRHIRSQNVILWAERQYNIVTKIRNIVTEIGVDCLANSGYYKEIGAIKPAKQGEENENLHIRQSSYKRI